MNSRRALVTGAGGQLGSDLSELLASDHEVHAAPHAELDIADDAAVAAALRGTSRPDVVFNCAAFHNVDVCEREEDRSFEVNARAVKRLASAARRRARRSSTSARTTSSTAGEPSPTTRTTSRAAQRLRDLEARRRARRRSPTAGALVVRSAGLYGVHGSASKGGNFVQRMLARAREQGELKMVADQRLTPTFTADLAAAALEAVRCDADGLPAPHELRRLLLVRVHRGDRGASRASRWRSSRSRRRAARRRPAPLNGVLARRRADELGLTPLRHWRDALADYMGRAGLAAAGVPRYTNGSSSSTSRSRGAEASRSDGISSTSGHSIPTPGRRT